LEGDLKAKDMALNELEQALNSITSSTICRQELNHAQQWLRELHLGVQQLMKWSRDKISVLEEKAVQHELEVCLDYIACKFLKGYSFTASCLALAVYPLNLRSELVSFQ